MAPGMTADLVTIAESSLSFQRPVKNVGPDVKERRLLVDRLQIVVIRVVRAVRAVIERETPRIGLVAVCDVG